MRRRIMLLAAGTALLAVALLAVPLGIVARNNYLRDERLELQRAAATAAARTSADLGTSRPARSVDGEIDVSVYDASGARVSGPGPSSAPPIVRAALAGTEADATGSARMSVAAPVADGDRVVAAVLLSTDLRAVHQRIVAAWFALAGMGLAAVTVAALGAAFVGRRLVRPIERLTVVARRVGDGDLAARAAPSGVGEIDALADTLNGSVSRLETMLGRERTLSREVSHQLRTPLSRLRLDLEATLSTPTDRTALTRALDHVDELEATVADVIKLARDVPVGERVPVAALLDAAVRRWHGPLAARSRPLRLSVSPDAPAELPLSRAAATQILDILLDNAVRHGHGEVSVTLRPADDGTLRLDVRNAGPPLALEAWQLFRQPGDDAREADAEHGIGLPFARKLAEAEGARLAFAAADPPTFRLTTVMTSSSTVRT